MKRKKEKYFYTKGLKCKKNKYINGKSFTLLDSSEGDKKQVRDQWLKTWMLLKKMAFMKKNNSLKQTQCDIINITAAGNIAPLLTTRNVCTGEMPPDIIRKRQMASLIFRCNVIFGENWSNGCIFHCFLRRYFSLSKEKKTVKFG